MLLELVKFEMDQDTTSALVLQTQSRTTGIGGI